MAVNLDASLCTKTIQWVDKTNIFEMINTLVITQDCLQPTAVIDKEAVAASASQPKLMGQVPSSF
jgi:hypothetical protein